MGNLVIEQIKKMLPQLSEAHMTDFSTARREFPLALWANKWYILLLSARTKCVS
jgi:hypothetical protein